MQALNSNYQLPTKQGWPKLVFAVYERDGWAQTDAFAAYGVCNLPLTPGLHDVEAHCWRANNRNARMREEIAALFAGARAELDGWKQCVIRREELYSSPAVTVGMGSVHIQVAVVTKNLDISGLHVGGVNASAAADKARRAALRARAGIASSPGAGGNDEDSPMQSPRNWPGSPGDQSGVESVRRRGGVGGGNSAVDDAPPSRNRFSAPGASTGRSFRSSVGAAADAFGGGGGRRARGSAGAPQSALGGAVTSLLSERRASRGGGVGAGAGTGGGIGSYGGYQAREQIEDEPLKREAAPGGRRSRAFPGGAAGAGDTTRPGGRRSRGGY